MELCEILCYLFNILFIIVISFTDMFYMTSSEVKTLAKAKVVQCFEVLF